MNTGRLVSVSRILMHPSRVPVSESPCAWMRRFTMRGSESRSRRWKEGGAHFSPTWRGRCASGVRPANCRLACGHAQLLGKTDGLESEKAEAEKERGRPGNDPLLLPSPFE